MVSFSPNETKLELLLDGLQTGVILYHPVFHEKNSDDPVDFEIIYSNTQVTRWTGVSAAELKGQRIQSLAYLEGEHRRILFEQIQQVYKTGETRITSFYNGEMDRHFKQVRTKIANNILSEITDISAELSERKEKERQSGLTDQILDQSINAWLTCESIRNGKGEIIDLLITKVNPAFSSIIGLPTRKVVGKTYLSIFPSARENGIFDLNCRVLETGNSERRLFHYVGDGLDSWYEVAVSRLGTNSVLITLADFSILGKAPYGLIQYQAIRNEEGEVIDFVHRSFNAVAVEVSGFSFTELSSKTCRELCVMRNNMTLFEQSVKVMETRESAQLEYYVAKVNVWIRFSIVPYEDGVLMNFIDITERILQEKKVQEKANQLARIMDASLNAVYVWKAIRDDKGVIVDMRYTMINRKYEELIGKKEEEVIGKTSLEIFPGLRGTELFQRYVSVIETGKPITFEDYYKADGLDMWFEASAVKMDHDEVVIAFRDITEQKEAALKIKEQNNFLDSILVNSPSGIVVVNMIRDNKGVIVDGRVILMNDAAEKYTQYPKEIMLTRTSVEMEPHILETPLYQKVLKTMETGIPFQMQYQMEMTGQWVEMNVARIDKDHLVNVFTDVTQRKNEQLKRETMLHDLKRSNEALEEFTRAASHDLKEPVRKVHFFVTRLRSELESTLKPSQLDLFTRVEKAADRMKLLIDDLLDYTHLNTSPPEKERIDLNEKLRNVISDLDLTIQEKKAKILVDPLPVIYGYRRQLAQLFQNLISNSLKYSKKNVPPKIKITARSVTGKSSGLAIRPADSDRRFHLIEMSDNGIGFDNSESARIFDVFTRLHGNQEFPGTGIGLSIVRKVAENHGGYVTAEGRPGEGAVFKILFPDTDS